MAAIDDLYYQVGGLVTGQVQDYLDQIYQGAKDGSLAEGDVIAALKEERVTLNNPIGVNNGG